MATIIDFLGGLFSGGKKKATFDEAGQAAREALFSDSDIKNLAVLDLCISAAVTMIANAVSVCEFQTYTNGSLKKDVLYYRLNVKPNPNENASEFKQKLVWQLLTKNEALIIRPGKEHFLVADSYSLKFEGAVKDSVYEGVFANGFQFSGEWSGENILHLKLNNGDVTKLLNIFYREYKKMISSSVRAYQRTRGERGILETTRLPGTEDYEKTLLELKTQYFDPYFKNDNAVVPLFDGQKYIKTSDEKAISPADDTQKLIETTLEIVARAYQIPPGLLKGEIADAEHLLNNFLTFCVNPLCRMIGDEINARCYSMFKYLSGNKVRVDTANIKHFGIFDIAVSVDKLISSGFASINETRTAAGLSEINEDYGDKHWLTKNYQSIENLAELEGGET